jgi:hypothetical protein
LSVNINRLHLCYHLSACMASPPNCIINQLVYQYLYEFLGLLFGKSKKAHTIMHLAMELRDRPLHF